MRVPSISSFTRRHFLSRSGLFGLASILPIGGVLSYFVRPVLASAQTHSDKASVVKNRAPLASSTFSFLAARVCAPRGLA